VKNGPNSNDFVPKVGQILAPVSSGAAAEKQVDRKRGDTFERSCAYPAVQGRGMAPGKEKIDGPTHDAK
jgi:hypothetical protein